MADLNSELKALFTYIEELLSIDEPNKFDMLRYKYLIENNFDTITKIEWLPKLDSTIISESIEKSIVAKTSKNDYLRPVDYQFYLLLFLFYQSHKYYKSWPSLHFIIDSFLSVIKNNLKYPDIEQTESGATRCKTNIRFALNDLRNLGLVNSLNRDKRRTWAPTYFGFFVAAYICINDNSSPFDFHISRVKNLPFIGKYDIKLYNTIRLLNSEKEFDALLVWLKNNSLDLEELNAAPEIFGAYSQTILNNASKYDVKNISKKEFHNSLREMLSDLEKQYNYSGFMRELSLQFDAIRVFDQLKHIMK